MYKIPAGRGKGLADPNIKLRWNEIEKCWQVYSFFIGMKPASYRWTNISEESAQFYKENGAPTIFPEGMPP